jgi:hypothetical protein
MARRRFSASHSMPRFGGGQRDTHTEVVGARPQGVHRDELILAIGGADPAGGTSRRSVPWAGAGDEPVPEVTVEGQRLLDSAGLHNDEAQAVDGTVVLVLVLREIVEGPLFLILRGPVDSSQDLAIESCADPNCRFVAIEFSSKGDGLEDDVIRG